MRDFRDCDIMLLANNIRFERARAVEAGAWAE